jgi:hypothetical protein
VTTEPNTAPIITAPPTIAALITAGRMLTSSEAARIIGLTKSALAQWRLAKIGPDFVRLSDTVVRYPEAALYSWLEERRIRTSLNDEEAARAVARQKKAAWRAKRVAGAQHA